MWGHGWGFWPAMMLMMVLFWGLIIAGIVVLVRSFRNRGAGGAPPEEALARRFARGEIDEDEYRRRLAALRASR
jgi:putative membrane protein